jgi:flagellum-specific peptidoglycan hydrolase FlgJ
MNLWKARISISLKEIIIIGLLVVIIILCRIIRTNDCDHVIKYNINYIYEAELKYFETKSKLVSEIQDYMESIAPTTNLRALDIVDLCDKYGVDIKFVLAQAEIESSFGTKGLAAKTRSVFNLGAFDDYTYDKIHHKYKYQHPNASVEPYLKLLNEKYLVDKTEYDLMVNYVDKHNTRYASDEEYEKKLSNKYVFIKNNTSIDSLQNVMRYYAINCNR